MNRLPINCTGIQASKSIMGVDLFSLKNNQDIAFNWSAWRFLKKTALDFGWKPLGTVINPEASMIVWEEDNLSEIEWHRIKKGMERVGETWEGNYDTNDTQTVTDQDAANLLQALTRAINDQDFLESIDEGAFAVIKEFMDFLKNGSFLIG